MVRAARLQLLGQRARVRQQVRGRSEGDSLVFVTVDQYCNGQQ